MSAVDALPPPVTYFPIRSGRYRIAPDFNRLPAVIVGGQSREAQVFQIDNEFKRYRENKRRCHAERRSKYIARHNLPSAVESAACRWILDRLCAEYPSLFAREATPAGGTRIECALTGNSVEFDSDMALVTGPGTSSRRGFDDLVDEIQEDACLIVRSPEEGTDRVAAVNVCSPSHWAPEKKVGASFDQTHRPVPGMERLRSSASRGLVSAMIGAEDAPLERFTFGIEFDDRLNHHPDPPGRGHVNWNARLLDPLRQPSPVYFRVERQVVVGLPQVDAALFLIRVYCYDGRIIRADPEKRDALISALHSMSPESREYKGLNPACFGAVIEWLSEAGAERPSA